MSLRVYPAYGRSIAALRARGTRASVIGVLLSSRWRYFDVAPKVCIRPDEWLIGRWEFGFVRGGVCVAIWGDEVEPVQFGELLAELMLFGPRLLWACDSTGKWLYQGDSPIELAAYAQRLTGAQHRGRIVAGRETYEHALGRELEIERTELARAIEAGRARIGYLERRRHAEDLARRIFSEPIAEPNDLAA